MTNLTNRPNYRAPWTAEDCQRLATLLQSNRSMFEVAKELGRSQEAVRNKAWKLGLLDGGRRAVRIVP